MMAVRIEVRTKETAMSKIDKAQKALEGLLRAAQRFTKTMATLRKDCQGGMATEGKRRRSEKIGGSDE